MPFLGTQVLMGERRVQVLKICGNWGSGFHSGHARFETWRVYIHKYIRRLVLDICSAGTVLVSRVLPLQP